MITIRQMKIELKKGLKKEWHQEACDNSEQRLALEDLIDSRDVLRKKAAKILGVNPTEVSDITILKHSIDARKKAQIFQVYTLGVALKNKGLEEKVLMRCSNGNVARYTPIAYQFPAPGKEVLAQRPVIIGMGPAGLFCGYMLARHGYRPILLERGVDVETRTKDVEAYWNGGSLKPESNVQFGEGGAGTFSDGKLNTLVKDKSGRNAEVLRIFVEFGAPEHILYESRPHIGTDILKKVVANMRNDMIRNGGEVRFGAKVTGLGIADGALCSVMINDSEVLPTTQAVLAIGHSARDTFTYLDQIGIPMEAKAFAVGMRVEHPQRLINECMYGREFGDLLPAAPYKLTAQSSTGRGVYSFCMCPGGYIVNASSEPGQIAVNGMSCSDRGSGRANSAIIVQVTPADYGADGPLAGIAFQRQLERKAYSIGSGRVPVQYYGDYKRDQRSGLDPDPGCPQPDIKGAHLFSNLRGLLPGACEQAFMEGMEEFDRVIKGFAGDHALLAGIESRTSSPVRICRDDALQCPTARGLYPCGEGAGYAGGITSAAMDGIRVAEQIAGQFGPCTR